MNNLLLFGLLFSTSVFANQNSSMPKSCEKKILSKLGDGSVQISSKDILKILKSDWKSNPENDSVHYDDCGPSDFFYITVKKENCKIVELGSGDSDGECN